MEWKIASLIIFSILLAPCFAIFNDYEPSARARAMSGAVTSFSDDYSAIFYNPAGIRLAGKQVGGSHYRLFGNDFSVVTAVSGAWETRFGSFGIGYQSMGVQYLDVSLMSESQLSVGHSFRLNEDMLSELTLGYSLSLYSLSFDGLGNESQLGINAGVIAAIHQRTQLGFMLTNINKPGMGKNQRHYLPQMLALGLSYAPYEGVITAIDLKKNYEGVTELRTGVEAEVHPMFILRMGVRNHPASYSAGVGFRFAKMMLDYSINTHPVLNLTHHIGLGIKY